MSKYSIENPAKDAVGDDKVWKVFRDGNFVEPPFESSEAAISHAGKLERDDLEKHLRKQKKISDRDYDKALRALSPLLDALDQQIRDGVLADRPSKPAEIEDSLTRK
jgi:hypothetical protein